MGLTAANSQVNKCAPRARGDGPLLPDVKERLLECSPRPRGWSVSPGGNRRKRSVLPAPAGMVRARQRRSRTAGRAPRARGDGPGSCTGTATAAWCSPRPRGWSGRSAPAGTRLSSAPRARGDGPPFDRTVVSHMLCSPRPRGWSAIVSARGMVRPVLPAPARMVRNGSTRRRGGWRAPRARGDGPPIGAAVSCRSACSPRPRGWSSESSRHNSALAVLPAPAGMVLQVPIISSSDRGAPRARGDGPCGCGQRHGGQSCSPRPRGWSGRDPPPHRRRRVLPAPAGMVLSCPTTTPACRCAPRARGDGPPSSTVTPLPKSCSPRPRGWSGQ